MAQWIQSLKEKKPFTAVFNRSRQFSSDISGNVGMMLAVSSMALIAVVGAAIDYSQMTSDIQKAQDTVDNAVLAASHEYYQEFVRENAQIAATTSARLHMARESRTGEHDVSTEFTETSQNKITIKSTISGTSRHNFMGLFGNKETKWTQTAYSEVSVPQVEVFLVVDASASMNGAKINRMKSALTKFVKDVAPYRNGESRIAVTLLPYAENVNFGKQSQSWLDPEDERDELSEFNGCFAYRNNDRPGKMISTVNRAKVNGFPFCPPRGSEAVLFATNELDLTNSIKNIQLGWGTDTTRALIWAERLFDPAWRTAAAPFAADRPMTVGPETEKIVIVLTDGAIAITDENEDGRRDGRRAFRRNTNAANTEFAKTCRSLQRVENLHIYTVAYSIKDKALENRLKNCVTGDGEHFNAEVGNLDPIFQKILSELTPIRISG